MMASAARTTSLGIRMVCLWASRHLHCAQGHDIRTRRASYQWSYSSSLLWRNQRQGLHGIQTPCGPCAWSAVNIDSLLDGIWGLEHGIPALTRCVLLSPQPDLPHDRLQGAGTYSQGPCCQKARLQIFILFCAGVDSETGQGVVSRHGGYLDFVGRQE